jgi:hypothetical protein
LPPRADAALEKDAALGGRTNFMDAETLEVCRPPLMIPGLLLASMPFWLFGTKLAIGMALDDVRQFEPDSFRLAADVGLGVLDFLMLVANLLVIWTIYRLDMRMPRQMPVRFSRAANRVYWNCHRRTRNLFGRWPQVLKSWDWDAVRAEIHNTGTRRDPRYRLVLLSHEPGSNLLIDSEYLTKPGFDTNELRQAWAYICAYMESGPAAVPKESFQDHSVHYIRSLFRYYEWALPGVWGERARRNMFGQGVGMTLVSLVFIGVTFVGAPLFFYLGVTNYFALRLAPDFRWPSDVDSESRGVASANLHQLPGATDVPSRKISMCASIVAASLTLLVAGWVVFVFLLRFWR